MRCSKTLSTLRAFQHGYHLRSRSTSQRAEVAGFQSSQTRVSWSSLCCSLKSAEALFSVGKLAPSLAQPDTFSKLWLIVLYSPPLKIQGNSTVPSHITKIKCTCLMAQAKSNPSKCSTTFKRHGSGRWRNWQSLRHTTLCHGHLRIPEREQSGHHLW